MKTLNLPKTEFKIISRGEKLNIFDILRRRYVTLTPEEWVRQHFIHFLIEYKGYPAARMGNEISLDLNGTQKRCDSVLYDKEARPIMIIEYKAPHIPITQETFQQISRYNMKLHVPWLIVSNGMEHYCCQVDYEKGEYHFLSDIPQYDAL